MTLDEFAALVRLEPARIEEWRTAGLLDPAGEGRFDYVQAASGLEINKRMRER